LRSLTDEPAEQAVQKAILAAEGSGDESIGAEQQGSPPIPISELPTKDETTDIFEAQGQSPIPIVELSPDSKSTIPAQQQQQQIHPTRDYDNQIAD
jgi:hypothetical protein